MTMDMDMGTPAEGIRVGTDVCNSVGCAVGAGVGVRDGSIDGLVVSPVMISQCGF